MKKVTIVLSGIFLLGIIALFIYFVTGVSATYPAIKKYRYKGTLNEFIKDIKKLSNNRSNLNVDIIDTVGNKNNGDAIYLNIETIDKLDDVEYNLRCESSNSNNVLIQTAISLVGAYDKKRNIGGYSKEAKGVKMLTEKFDIEVINLLKGNQKGKISSL